MGAEQQCAMTVLPGASAVAGNLLRVLPYVLSGNGMLLCFFGFLKNTKDLVDRLHLDPSAQHHDDIGSMTTDLIKSLFLRLQKENKDKFEELLLSELQGHYAFFLYDSERKQALAARDPSGEQELFYRLDPDDGSVAFTNSLDQLPEDESNRGWLEVPPGHFVSGATLRQFALTPEQLQKRERDESCDLGSLDSFDEADAERLSSPTSKPGLFARISNFKLKA